MAGLDAECPACGTTRDVAPGTPYPAKLRCIDCGASFLEDTQPLLGVM